MFKIPSKYFSIFSNAPPANKVSHKTRDISIPVCIVVLWFKSYSVMNIHGLLII